MDDTHHDPTEICTLSTSALEERLRWIRTEVLPHAVHFERQAGAVSWELDDVAGLAERLDRLIALERECCSGIVVEHQRLASGARRLTLRGVDPDAAVFQGFGEASAAAPGPGRRLAGAAGIGTLAGVLVCCVVPLAAAAILGGATAAPLAGLDDPWVIVGASLLFGTVAFAWMGRKRPASGEGCGPGC
jgi:hypothetical protein